MGYYFKMPLILSTSFAFFGYAWVLYTFLTWFPIYLAQVRGVDLKGMAIVGAIPWVCGVIGLAAGGFITDFIVQRTRKPITARISVIIVGLTVTAVLFALIGVVETTAGAVTLMSIVVFALYVTCAQYFAVVSDIVPSQRLGGVMGFVHSIANLAGIISPVVVGTLIDKTGNWALIFVLSAVICIVGVLLLLLSNVKRLSPSSS